MIISKSFILCIVVSLLSSSCSKDSKNPVGPNTTTVKTELSQKTKMIENQTSITSETVSDNSILYTFSGKTPDIDNGDVIVGSQDTWYLRKVKQVSVKDNTLTIETEQARLNDAVVRTKVDTVVTLESQGAGKIVYAAKGVSLVDGKIDLTGVSLFSGSVNGIKTDVTITSGQISFKPDLNIGFLINKVIKEFHFVPHGELVFDCDISATSKGAWENNHEIMIISLQYFSWIYIPGTVIAVPLITTISFNAGYEITSTYLDSLSTGYGSNFQVDVGAKYEDSKWSPVWETSFEKQVHKTVWTQNGACTIRCYVTPKIDTKIAGFAGPNINVVPYLDFDGKIGGEYAWKWELYGGISANIGFDVSFLGYDIVDYSKEMVAYEKVLDSKSQFNGTNNNHKNIIYVLDDNDNNYLSPTIYDTLYFLNDSGEVIKIISGLNICETLGAKRALVSSNDGSLIAVSENVANRLNVYSNEGKLKFSINNINAVDISSDNQFYSLTSSGTIYGNSIVIIDQLGSIIQEAYYGGFDIVVDENFNSIWIVGDKITKLDMNLNKIISLDPIEWCGVSIDYTSNGSVWIAERMHEQVNNSKNRLIKLSNDGKIILTINLGNKSPFCVSVDRYDDSVWVASDHSILKYNNAGVLLFEIFKSTFSIKVNPNDHSVWAGHFSSNKGVGHYSKDGLELKIITDKFSSGQKYIAISK